MANTRLSAAEFVTYGYGQVEPNHLAARRTGQIYDQLPADASINILENGQFVKYDYENGVVNFDGDGEWLLVFNEVKVYQDWESDQDFAMIKDNYSAVVYNALGELMPNGTKMVPRCLRTYPFDLYTTNTIHLGEGDELEKGMLLAPDDTDGILSIVDTEDEDYDEADYDMLWKIVKVYTMPDEQPGVKLQRIK